MAETKEAKLILEREYIVPLRKGWIKTPYYRRVKKSVKLLREFIAKHMKVLGRDEDKVRLDKWLNHELNFRNEKALAKIKVRCKKYDDGIVRVELAEIPAAIKHRVEREKRILTEGEKRAEEKKKEAEEAAKKAEEEEKKKEKEKTPEEIEKEKKEESEKLKSEEIAEEIRDKEHKKEMKHESTFPKQKNQVRIANQSSDKN